MKKHKKNGEELKVLHGMAEIAGQGIYSVKGLRANGVDTTMAVWRKNPNNYGVDWDLKIGRNKLKYPWYILKIIRFAIKAAREYNCFHFHFTHSLIPYNLDLFFLKLMNKKMFFEFHGSDLRGVFKHNIVYKYEPAPPESWSQQFRIKRIMKYAHGIILHDEELRGHLPKSDVPVYIVPLRLEIEKFKPKYPEIEKDVPLIVHAPSSREGKGTDSILAALDKVEEKFELVIVEGKTQEEAFKIYREADIVIDQISAGSYGVLAIESMALGKPVVSYINDEMKELLPSTLPIVSAEPFDLKEKVEELIRDGALRKRLGEAGRVYAETYHDYVKNGKLLKEIYEKEV